MIVRKNSSTPNKAINLLQTFSIMLEKLSALNKNILHRGSWQNFINNFHNNVKFTLKYCTQNFLDIKVFHTSQFTHFESFI